MFKVGSSARATGARRPQGEGAGESRGRECVQMPDTASSHSVCSTRLCRTFGSRSHDRAVFFPGQQISEAINLLDQYRCQELHPNQGGGNQLP